MSFPTQHHHFRASTPSTLPATPHVEPDGPYWPPLGAKGRNGEVETGTIGWLVPTAPGRTVLRIPTFRGQTSWKLGREHDSEAVSYANDVVLPGTFISTCHRGTSACVAGVLMAELLCRRPALRFLLGNGRDSGRDCRQAARPVGVWDLRESVWLGP